MGVDSEGRVDAVVLLGNRERRTARLDACPDCHDARHPCLARASDERFGLLCARVEVRMSVDHAAAVGVSMRGKSGAAAAIPWTSAVRP